MAKAAAAPATTIVRRTSSAATKRLEEAKDQLKRRADKARMGRNETRAMLTRIGSGFVLGYADRKGWIDKLPDTGLPKLAVAGIIAKVGGHYTSGKGGDILNGAGDAALTVMAYQWGSSAGIERTATTSGARMTGNARADALEAKFRRQLAEARADLEDEISGYDDDVYDDEVGDYDDEVGYDDDEAGSVYTGDYDYDDGVGAVYDVGGTTSDEEAADFGYF